MYGVCEIGFPGPCFLALNQLVQGFLSCVWRRTFLTVYVRSPTLRKLGLLHRSVRF